VLKTGEVVKPTAGTVALYVSKDHEHARAVAARVSTSLRSAGFEVAFAADSGDALSGAIMLVTVGGDGTLLRAAQLAAPLGVPLFGINTGRLGFLTETDANGREADALLEALREGFIVEERVALRARLNDRVHFALNDIVVRRSATGQMAPFGLYIDDKEAAFVPADGVVIATPTGSTAYLLSAGGPILAPDVAAFGIVALAPHTLFTRPLVVPDSSTIELVSGSREPATLEADGRIVDELPPGPRVTIDRAPQAVRFARRAPLNFFAVLEDKLRWNAPLKGGGGTGA
jgi:NAD+ kinase